MCEHTRRAITALLATDECATDEERRRVAAAMAGDAQPTMTVVEVARRLGVCRPTVYKLLRAGRIQRLGDMRAEGISRASVERYLAGKGGAI